LKDAEGMLLQALRATRFGAVSRGRLGAVTSRIKRRKPASERRTAFLRVRLTDEQHELITTAAASMGISISAWTVMSLVRAAREQAKRT
jgi:hypothetical protein